MSVEAPAYGSVFCYSSTEFIRNQLCFKVDLRLVDTCQHLDAGKLNAAIARMLERVSYVRADQLFDTR
jgi:hypothetical protein